jgi:hypothetical protein
MWNSTDGSNDDGFCWLAVTAGFRLFLNKLANYLHFLTNELLLSTEDVPLEAKYSGYSFSSSNGLNQRCMYRWNRRAAPTILDAEISGRNLAWFLFMTKPTSPKSADAKLLRRIMKCCNLREQRGMMQRAANSCFNRAGPCIINRRGHFEQLTKGVSHKTY